MLIFVPLEAPVTMKVLEAILNQTGGDPKKKKKKNVKYYEEAEVKKRNMTYRENYQPII